MAKLICAKCGKPISGNAKVGNQRKKIGNKTLNQVCYYHDHCFKALNEERCWNEYRKKEAANKAENTRRVQRRRRKNN